jgi:hypothetical protein
MREKGGASILDNIPGERILLRPAFSLVQLYSFLSSPGIIAKCRSVQKTNIGSCIRMLSLVEVVFITVCSSFDLNAFYHSNCR